MVRCPKCGHSQVNTIECGKCGIIFARYYERMVGKEGKSAQKGRADGRKGLFLWLGGIALVVVAAGGAYWLLMGKQEAPAMMPATPLAAEEEGATVAGQSPKRSATLGGLAAELNRKFPPANALERVRNATVLVKSPWGSGAGFLLIPRGTSLPIAMWWSSIASNWRR